MVTKETILSLLQDIWPDLTDWLPTDREYDDISTKEIDDLIASYNGNAWKKNVWECEEIASDFVSFVRRKEYLEPARTRNRAVGRAFGSMFKGVEKDHTVNVFISDGKVYLLDMQKKKYWPAVSSEDECYWIDM